MADSPCFEHVCAALESETSLDRLETRGTVRLALKGAGLDAAHATPDQMGVVIGRPTGNAVAERFIQTP